MIPAPIGRRFGAIFIDLSIVSFATYIASLPLLWMIGPGFEFEMTADGAPEFPVAVLAVGALFLIASTLAIHAYFIFFELRKGATPGKSLLGLKVVSTSGEPLTRQQAIGRDMARWYIDAIFGIPAFISILVTKKRQRVGDILAGTVVIDARPRNASGKAELS